METLSKLIKQYHVQDLNYANGNTQSFALNEANCCCEAVCDY